MVRGVRGLARIEEMAIRSGMVRLSERGRHAIEAGLTDPAEFRRVLGITTPPASGLGLTPSVPASRGASPASEAMHIKT